jgi:hypothetical protein
LLHAKGWAAQNPDITDEQSDHYQYETELQRLKDEDSEEHDGA